MFCANCGTQNSDDSLFCSNCGERMNGEASSIPVSSDNSASPIPIVPASQVASVSAEPSVPADSASPVNPPVNSETPVAPVTPVTTDTPVITTPPVPVESSVSDNTESQNKSKKIKPLFFIIIGAALLLLILIIVLIANFAGKSGKDSIGDTSIDYYYSPDEDETYIIIDGSLLKDSIPGQLEDVVSYSANYSTIIVCNEDDEYYAVTKKGIAEIGEDFYSISVSYNGSKVIYIDDDDELYLYDVATGKETSIAEDIEEAVISPSGKAVAYVDDDDNALYVYNGRKEIEIGGDSIEPVGLSDDCKYIYYYNWDKDALYVTDLKDNDNKIASDIYDYSLNSDCTEILFETENGVYVSRKGGDKVKITGEDEVMPLEYYIGLDYCYSEYSDIKIWGLSTFAGHYYYDYYNDCILYVDRKFETEKVVKNVYSHLAVSDDLSKIYYLNDSYNLYSCKLSGDYDTEKIKSDISDVTVVPGGTAIYFTNDDDTLYYKAGNKDPEKIASDVSSFDVTHDGYCLFITDFDYDDYEGNLYYSKNGGEKVKISSECIGFNCYYTFTTFIDNYEFDYSDYSYSYNVNLAKNGIKFETILEIE